MNKLVILQTVLPDYRKKLFLHIDKELDSFVEIYGGDTYFEKSVKTDDTIALKKHVKNVYLFNRKFLFQLGMWTMVTKPIILVIELNPRILSNWLVLIVRKILGLKTILWGHAWPRSGNNSRSDTIRNLMRTLGNEIIVYTKTQKKELQIKMPNKIIKVAPNSVFFKNEMKANNEKDKIKNIIYVGRLSKRKKALFLVQAFHVAMKNLDIDAKLIIIGDGEEKELIQEYIKKNNLFDRIEVLGHIGDYHKLKSLYATSLASISPGYIGLSVTQSFGFGVPMIVSKREDHSPEIEATVENENTIFFETDVLDSLSESILSIYKDKDQWVNKRKKISDNCKNSYSVEAMAQSFINLGLEE